MASLDRFEIVLLPRRDVLATGLTLAEAAAYVDGYHNAVERGRQEAVIAVVSRPEWSESGRRLRRSDSHQSGYPEKPSALLRSA